MKLVRSEALHRIVNQEVTLLVSFIIQRKVISLCQTEYIRIYDKLTKVNLRIVFELAHRIMTALDDMGLVVLMHGVILL